MVIKIWSIVIVLCVERVADETGVYCATNLQPVCELIGDLRTCIGCLSYKYSSDFEFEDLALSWVVESSS